MVIVALLAIQLIWGVNWIFSKLALAEIPPLALMTLRFFATSLVFAPFMRWHPGEMGKIAVIALLGGALNFGLGFIALAMAHDIAPLAIAANLGVPFATLLSALFLGDRIGIWRGSALALAFGGIAVMAFDPRVMSYIDAVAVNALASCCWAGGTILMRWLKERIGALDMQGWIALGAWPPLAIASLLSEHAPVQAVLTASLFTWLSLGFIVVFGTLIAHGGFTYIVQRHPFPRLAPYMLIAPVIASILGVVVLGNEVSGRLVIGGALTLVGVLVITIREAQKALARGKSSDVVAIAEGDQI